MHTSTNSEFMLLIVGYEWDEGLAPAETRQAIDRMFAWFDRLLEQGIATAGSPLSRMGKLVSGKNGDMVADGPFAEAKEVVGGFIVVQADDLDAATAIAQQCPLLEYGITVDVRAMVNECSIALRLKEQAALATH